MILHLQMPATTKVIFAICFAFYTYGLVKFDFEEIFYRGSLFFGSKANTQFKKPNLYLYN